MRTTLFLCRTLVLLLLFGYEKQRRRSPRTSPELGVLMEVLVAYSNGDSCAPAGEYWNPIFWKTLCEEYNKKAARLKLELHDPTSLVDDGLELQKRYCALRGVS